MIHRSPSASHRFSIVQGINSFSEVAELLRNSVSVSGRLFLVVGVHAVGGRRVAERLDYKRRTASNGTVPDSVRVPTPDTDCVVRFMFFSQDADAARPAGEPSIVTQVLTARGTRGLVVRLPDPDLSRLLTSSASGRFQFASCLTG